MIKIGQYNRLTVAYAVDFGVYLTDGTDTKILLPTRYVPQGLQENDEIEVFVYKDNEGRLIATTERPYATVGQFAYMQVSQVNNVGAFLDWGIMKDILVPFREQKMRMRPGGIYLVYVYLDHTTQRVVASAKVEKFLGNVVPRYKRGDKVSALVTEHVKGIGYRAIVDNLHYGMIYENELYHPIELESTVEAVVRQVREDGKIDLFVGGNAVDRTTDTAGLIMEALMAAPDNTIMLGDKSSPEEIKAAFSCSKKDFKKALGHLYKEQKILISDTRIQLAIAD